jgi:hypothetical protein
MLPVCLCIPPINFWMSEPIFMKLGVYSQHMSPSQQRNSLIPRITPCVCIGIPLSSLGNGLVKKKKKRYRGNKYTSNKRLIVARVVLYAAHVVSQKLLVISKLKFDGCCRLYIYVLVCTLSYSLSALLLAEQNQSCRTQTICFLNFKNDLHAVKTGVTKVDVEICYI